MSDLTQFKQHILLFLQSKQVESSTIQRVAELMNTMDDQHLFLFCEFSFILKRRECDPVKKTGEHAIRDYLQTFWHDENRLVKDLRYSDYIHYFTKYHRCAELFDFFKLCTEHGNRKRPLSYTVKLQEFMATPIETLRSRSERKGKISGVKKSTTRITGMKRIKQEDMITPIDLEYIPPAHKKSRHMNYPSIPLKSEVTSYRTIPTIKSEPIYDPTPSLIATEFTPYEEQWSPVSQDSDMYSSSHTSSPMSSPKHLDSPISSYSSEHEQYPTYSYPSVVAAPTWTRIPSLSNPEVCASEVDWDAIAQDLNKTYAPIVEAAYSSSSYLQTNYPTQYGWYGSQQSTASY